MKTTQPHGKDLRNGRISEAGRIYLITCVTDRRKAFFSHWTCGRLLVQVLMKERNRAETLAYVVMPDHLHWLVQLKESITLGGLMRSVKSISSRQINRKLNRSGRLWQAGYHDHALRKEEDLVSTARYVVANPLRAGLVTCIGDYPLWDAVWL
jgi:REP element-mobilizing transposase RayT